MKASIIKEKISKSVTAQRIILITGATDGLGRRTAEILASPDVHLIVHGRDPIKGRAVVEAIEAAGGSAIFYEADFASLSAVRRMAEAIATRYAQIDLLINNAGITYVDGQRRLSEDGHELHFAVNYLAAFLLFYILRPCLGQLGPSRVINVASAAQNKIDFRNVMLERGYDGYRAYGQSKLADIMFSLDIAQEFKGSNITSASLHPGTYMDTKMVRAAGIRPMTSVNVGAEAVLALVSNSSEVISGRYFDGKRETRAHAQAYDLMARRQLRQLSMALTGLQT
jgi:NAD(P)-dependent dehydrogenase (short-subunit alcohol dehydrogenase family)